MITPALLRSHRTSATLKKHPATNATTGVRGEPITVVGLTLKIAPIDPISPEMIERYRLETPVQKKVTYTYTDYAIESGMYLSVGGKDYPIKGVGPYSDGSKTFYELILEDVKAA